jgi:hypothetical protein
LLLDRALGQVQRSFLPGYVVASKVFQLANCVPSVFVDGTGVKATAGSEVLCLRTSGFLERNLGIGEKVFIRTFGSWQLP